MGFLLDTHAMIWWVAGDERLPRNAREAIASVDADVYVSAASAWEVATKVRLGKLPGAVTLAAHFTRICRDQGFSPLPITLDQALAAGTLDGAHRDPFDRMLIAQSLLLDLTLISNERLFDDYGVNRLWQT